MHVYNVGLPRKSVMEKWTQLFGCVCFKEGGVIKNNNENDLLSDDSHNDNFVMVAIDIPKLWPFA